jgi:hypothetical protein
MKYVWTLLVVILVAGQSTVTAQETPEQQLDFIRKLRAKGYGDLAMEKLEEFKKTAPAALQPLVPVEMARTRIALARHKSADEKLNMAREAEKELRDFVTKNAGKKEAALASLELARLSNFQGQAWLNKALGQENSKEAEPDAKKAGEFFAMAMKELEAAEKDVPEDEKPAVRFDRGTCLIDQARVLFVLQEYPKGGELMREASKVLKEVYEADEKGTALGILSAAWLIKANIESDDYKGADNVYKAIMRQTGAAARPAQRWARLFNMQRILKDPLEQPKNPKADVNLYKFGKIQAAGESWLTDHWSFRNAPEGYAVRYELANAYFEEGKLHLRDVKDPKEPKTAAEKKAKATALAVLAKAQKLYSELAETDTEYAEKSSQKYVQIAAHRMSEMKLSDMKTFEETYLKAQFDIGRLSRVMDELGKASDVDKVLALQKQRKAVLKDTLKAIQRSLVLAESDNKTPAKKILEARFKQLEVYYTMGDMYRTIVIGEMMAREPNPTKRSASAAAYALEAYSKLLPADDTDATRGRMRELALFITANKAFKDDSVVPTARFRLGMLAEAEAQSEKAKGKNKEAALKFEEAITHLEQLPESYTAYCYATCQLAFIALTARENLEKERDAAADDNIKKEKDAALKKFEEKARAALLRIKLPKNPDSHTAYAYFLAQGVHCKFIFLEAADFYQKEQWAASTAKFMEMSKFNAKIQAEFDAIPATILTLEADGKGVPLQVTADSKFHGFKGANIDATLRELDDGSEVYFLAGERDGKATLAALATKSQDGLSAAKIKKLDFGKLTIDGQERVRATLTGLENLSRLSRAEIDYRNSNFDKVLEAKQTGDVVERIQKMAAAKPGPIALKDFDVMGKLLGLALRANVQKGNVAKGRDVLKLLERLAPGDGVLNVNASDAVLKALIYDMQVQVRDLRKNPDDKAKLDETIKNYSAFLDDFANSAGKKGLQPAEILFLADCYESMQEHVKAADYYGKVPKSEWLDKPVARNLKLKGEEEKREKDRVERIEQEIGMYCKAQLKLAQQHRVLKDNNKAYNIIAALKNHKNVRGLVYIDRENLFILEDLKLWGKVIKGWQVFKDNPGLQKAKETDEKFKRLYFEAYTHETLAWYQYSQLPKTKESGKEKNYLDTAADYILRLEYAANPEGWSIVEKEMRDAIEANPPLKNRYLELKRKYEDKKKTPVKGK